MNELWTGQLPKRLHLPDNEIHIWTIATIAPPNVVASLEQVLTAREAERAARFRFKHLRDSYVVAHGVLNHLLGSYLNSDPSRLEFVYGPKGKPTLAVPGRIQFNLSHSGDLAVIALTSGCEIGVDVEQIRSLSDMEPIARRFFHADEAAEILSLPEGEREHAFFCCWTRKEAYIKAIGDGLSTPLNGFRVTALPDDRVRIIHLNEDTGAAADWSLHDLHVASNYAAAVAYRDPPRPLTVYSLPKLAE